MRPPGLTPETHATIVQGLRLGMKRHEAAASVGITDRTLYRWIARGRAAVEQWERLVDENPSIDLDEIEDPEFEFREFYLAVIQADAGYKRSLVATITRAAVGAPAEYDDAGNVLREEVKPDARVALEMLARRDPREWGRTNRLPAEYAAQMDDEESGGTDPDAELDALRSMAFDLLERVEEKRGQREQAGVDPAD